MTLRDHHGRTDMRRAALKRLNDARALMSVGLPHARAAGYLAGYSVECLLKANAMLIFNCWTLEQLASTWKVDERDVYTHGLLVLFKRLPQFPQFQRSPHWRKDFLPYLSRWRVSWRYNPYDWPMRDAQAFLGATQRIYKWIESNCG